MRTWFGLALGGSLLACGGLVGRDGVDPQVTEAIEAIEGTRLEATPDVLPPISLEGAGAPEQDLGKGVQVLQIAPVGEGRKALQAAVVFDRPMVPLSDLDSMNQSPPLSCAPGTHKQRWAGTSTAVVLPEGGGAFPRATEYTCTVPAGTTALDGVTLEKTLTWTFETPRPKVVRVTPRADAERVDPNEPLELHFDQPVKPESVAGHLTVKDGQGRAAKLEVKAGSDPTRVEVAATLAKATRYTVAVSPGVVGTEGPLPSTEAFSSTFETYGPLVVTGREPSGTAVDPAAGIKVAFSNPVPGEDVVKHLTIEPKPAGWDPTPSEWSDDSWWYWANLLPRTEYTVRLAAGVKDEYGEALAEPAEWSFRTGDYAPRLDVPDGLLLYAANNPLELPFRHLNTSAIDLRMARVAPGKLTDPEQWDELVKATLSGGSAVPVSRDKPMNALELDAADLRPYLQEGRGWVATRFVAPNVVDWQKRPREYVGLFVVTDLGATIKVGPASTEVWVTTLSGGAPVEGADVTVFKGTKEIGKARTDGDGLARVAAGPGDGWQQWKEEVWARVEKGADASLVRHRWGDGISPWMFGIYGGFEGSGHEVVGHAFADRGVYRPGDPAHARATFRLQDAGGLTTPTGTVRWTLQDPEGTAVESGEGKLDDRGGFAVSTAIPAEGALGDWTIAFEGSGQGWTGSAAASLMARAYRPPAFRVEVTAPADAVAGEEVTASVDARYLFGAPLDDGKARWRAWTEARWFEPEGWDGFSFGPERRWWEPDDHGGTETLGDREAPLAEGRSSFSQKVETPAKRPVALFLEAEVIDVDRQAIANRSETLIHPGKFYVGVRPAERLPKAGSPTAVKVVAVDRDGKAVSGVSAGVRVVRRTWDSVREKGMDGQWRWVNTPTDTEVATQSVTTSSSPVEVRFTPAEAGYHVVTVTAKDDAGHEVVGAEGVYVVGQGYVGWGRSDDQKMELVPDEKSYAPGDVARILVKAPAEGLRALVTAEREGVLWRQVVKLEGTAATVEVPITAAHRPNVYVSVLAVQGAGPQDAPDKGRPQVFVGMTELRVDATPEHLEVAITPSAPVFRPRDKVAVTVAVKRAGQAVAGAGVTLYAVDEAVLSLTAYETPDAFDAFYARHGLSVLTGDARIATLDRAPYLRKGALRGGGGGLDGDGPEVRSRFVTTVTWQPDLRTGPDGMVQATFDLPDNLTTFRVMAVADAGATGFGAADEEIRVTRPIVVRPALPRTLREGDEAYAGVVVHNNGEWDRWVDVTADVDGPLEIEGSPVALRVGPGQAVEVPFHLKALEIGKAKLTFRAVGGEERDAVEVTLPIGRDVPVEVTATAGTVEGEARERIAKPDGARGGFGGLEVEVASTALIGAGEGLEYLMEYPHGCIEQRTSEALGALMALRVRERAGVQASEEVLRGNVEGVLSELRSFRSGWNGLSYWPGDPHPSVMGTAYAVELMGRSKAAGLRVDEALLADSVGFLRDVIAGRYRDPWGGDPLAQIAVRAYVAHALAVAGEGDAGLVNRVYAQRRDLSVFGVASLLGAIVRTTGPDDRTAELEKIIASRTTIEAASASVKENQTGRWDALWASDDLSTAMALDALVAGGRKHVLAPKYALHLASSRRTGHWQNTRATAAALAALADYAEVYETEGDAVQGAVSLAGRELLAKAVSVPGSVSVALPLGDVQNGDLVFSAKELLYYQARLSYAPITPVPRDEGFTVTRTLEVLDGGGASGEVTAGATIRVTLTVVTPVQRHLVAVTDPLPAGLEALDSSLATTSRAPADEEESLGYVEDDAEERDEFPAYGGSAAFDHVELRDDRVLLYAEYLPPGIHTYRYVVRATTPGTFDFPPAQAEEMYEPENFGRTAGGKLVIGAAGEVASR